MVLGGKLKIQLHLRFYVTIKSAIKFAATCLKFVRSYNRFSERHLPITIPAKWQQTDWISPDSLRVVGNDNARYITDRQSSRPCKSILATGFRFKVVRQRNETALAFQTCVQWTAFPSAAAVSRTQ